MFENFKKQMRIRKIKKEVLKEHDLATERNRRSIDSVSERAKTQLEDGDYKGMARSLGQMFMLGATERGREYGRDKICDAKNKTQVKAFDFMTRAANKLGRETSKTIGRGCKK